MYVPTSVLWGGFRATTCSVALASGHQKLVSSFPLEDSVSTAAQAVQKEIFEMFLCFVHLQSRFHPVHNMQYYVDYNGPIECLSR